MSAGSSGALHTGLPAAAPLPEDTSTQRRRPHSADLPDDRPAAAAAPQQPQHAQHTRPTHDSRPADLLCPPQLQPPTSLPCPTYASASRMPRPAGATAGTGCAGHSVANNTGAATDGGAPAAQPNCQPRCPSGPPMRAGGAWPQLPPVPSLHGSAHCVPQLPQHFEQQYLLHRPMDPHRRALQRVGPAGPWTPSASPHGPHPQLQNRSASHITQSVDRSAVARLLTSTQKAPAPLPERQAANLHQQPPKFSSALSLLEPPAKTCQPCPSSHPPERPACRMLPCAQSAHHPARGVTAPAVPAFATPPCTSVAITHAATRRATAPLILQPPGNRCPEFQSIGAAAVNSTCSVVATLGPSGARVNAANQVAGGVHQADALAACMAAGVHAAPGAPGTCGNYRCRADNDENASAVCNAAPAAPPGHGSVAATAGQPPLAAQHSGRAGDRGAVPAVPGRLRAAWPRLRALFADSAADVTRLAAAVATAGTPAAAASAAALRQQRLTAALVLRASGAELEGAGIGAAAQVAEVRRVAAELCCDPAAAEVSAAERLLLSAPPLHRLGPPAAPPQSGRSSRADHPQSGHGGAGAAGAAPASSVSTGNCADAVAVRVPGKLASKVPAQLTLKRQLPRPVYCRASELRTWKATRRRLCRVGRAAPYAARGTKELNASESCLFWWLAEHGGEMGAGERLCQAILSGHVKYGKKPEQDLPVEQLDMSAVYDLDENGDLVIVRQ